MKKLLLILLLLTPLFAHANSTCDGSWVDHNKFSLTTPHVQGKCQCSSCHLGSFQAGSAGGGATCMSCHGGSRPAAMPKPADHIQTSLDCIQCHALKATFDNARMNHTGIISGCSTCHSKPPTHPSVTNPNCEACHNTTATGWHCISG
jgi:hypothetical protein